MWLDAERIINNKQAVTQAQGGISCDSFAFDYYLTIIIEPEEDEASFKELTFQ